MDIDGYQVVIYARIVYAAMVLLYFSYLDIKYRDIPARSVLFAGIGAAVLLGLSMPYYLEMYTSRFITGYILLSLLVGPGLLFLLYIFEMIGDADVAVSAIMVLLFPLPDIYDVVLLRSDLPLRMPPVMMITLYASLATVVLIPMYGLFNVLRSRGALADVEASPLKKAVLYMMGKPMRVSEYLTSKHYYPLIEYREEEGRLVKSIRASFSIKEEYYEHQERIKRLVDKGLLDTSDYIWVTYGIPFLVPYTIGLIATLLIGDYLLSLLIKPLIGL